MNEYVILKGKTDRIKSFEFYDLNKNRIDDITSEFTDGLSIYLYDNNDNLINKFSYPLKLGFDPIIILDHEAIIKIDSLKTENSATGYYYADIYPGIPDVDFSDGTYNPALRLSEIERIII